MTSVRWPQILIGPWNIMEWNVWMWELFLSQAHQEMSDMVSVEQVLLGRGLMHDSTFCCKDSGCPKVPSSKALLTTYSGISCFFVFNCLTAGFLDQVLLMTPMLSKVRRLTRHRSKAKPDSWGVFFPSQWCEGRLKKLLGSSKSC